MNCEQARDRLDAFMAGTLEPSERDLVGAHVASCAECTADLEAAQFLAPRTAALPRKAPADPALWAGIEARIQPRKSARWSGRQILGLAAALMLAMGAGWWLRGLNSVASRESRVARVETLPYETEVASLRAAMNDLEKALVQEGRLPTALSESFKRDLRILEGAITEASAALTADPGNDAVRELYRAAFRRKLEALRRAAAVYSES